MNRMAIREGGCFHSVCVCVLCLVADYARCARCFFRMGKYTASRVCLDGDCVPVSVCLGGLIVGVCGCVCERCV